MHTCMLEYLCADPPHLPLFLSVRLNPQHFIGLNVLMKYPFEKPHYATEWIFAPSEKERSSSERFSLVQHP